MARFVVGDDRSQCTSRRHSLSAKADDIRHQRERSLQRAGLRLCRRGRHLKVMRRPGRGVSRGGKAARKNPTRYYRSAQYIC
jgi:hypothetical protein